MKAEKFTELYTEVKKEWEQDILPFWTQNAVEEEGSGFYGRILEDGTPVPEAKKSLLLYSKILYGFSYAYKVSKKNEALRLAKRAYKYIVRFFKDEQNGGFYSILGANGELMDFQKQIRSTLTLMTALNYYYEVTKSKDVEAYLQELFFRVEEDYFDKEREIYYGQEHKMVMENTVLLLEFYVNFLKIERTREVAERLSFVMNLIFDKFYDQKNKHFYQEIDLDYKPTNEKVFYGLEMQLATSILDAIDALKAHGDSYFLRRNKEFSEIALEVIKNNIFEGQLKDGSMSAYYDPETHQLNVERYSDIQAETVMATVVAYVHTKDEEYLKAAVRTWYFLDVFMIDHKYGEWKALVGENGRMLTENTDKADSWRGPFHNLRMCMRVMEEYKKLI